MIVGVLLFLVVMRIRKLKNWMADVIYSSFHLPIVFMLLNISNDLICLICLQGIIL